MRGFKLVKHLEDRPMPPEMNELKFVYLDFVCEGIDEAALELFTRAEIVRHIAKALYLNLREKDVPPRKASLRVARILKISDRSVDRYRAELNQE